MLPQRMALVLRSILLVLLLSQYLYALGGSLIFWPGTAKALYHSPIPLLYA